MDLITYATAKEKIEQELDIQGSNFIDDDEMMGFFNSAIDEAEATIHQLYEDYFLTNDYVSMVDGTSSYSMPTNIYANKIRLVYYVSGSNKYTVDRILLKDIPMVESTDDYQYNIENDSGAGGTKFVLYPAAQETSSTVLRRWYIRNATTITSDSSVIDIPEFSDFVLFHVRERCAIKMGHPMLGIFSLSKDQKKTEMVNTLKQMVPDGNSHILPDVSHYEESEA